MPKDLGAWKKYVLICLPLLVMIVLGLVTYRWLWATTADIFQTDEPTPLLEQLNIIFGNDDRPVKGQSKDRINILLLGIGGDGHAGGTLTDSIMVVSIKPSTHQIALLSLPRDLVVKIYDQSDPKLWEGRKINYAYSLGGVDLVQDKVTEVTGLKLHYYSIVDFAGFRKIIDDIGGLDVDVERSFTGLYGANELSVPCPASLLYQLDDGAYCAIAYAAGTEHMDGERALIFSRIRKLAPGSANVAAESTDFARAQRQQKILTSFKITLFSTGTLLRPSRVTNVFSDLGDHLTTNLEVWEIAQLLRLTANVDSSAIIHQVIDETSTALVYSKIYEPTGASVVVPKAGDYDYSDIHQLAKKIFVSRTETLTEDFPPETATIEILNGTTMEGLAAATAEQLPNNFTITTIGNAADQGYTTTTIYDRTASSKPGALQQLTILFPRAVVITTAPTTPTDSDFSITLGSEL